MSKTARGTFEVKLIPQEDKVGDPTISRMSLDKQFHGDLEAASKGQMLGSKLSAQLLQRLFERYSHVDRFLSIDSSLERFD